MKSLREEAAEFLRSIGQTEESRVMDQYRKDLEKLDKYHEDALISEAEYQEKRKALISSYEEEMANALKAEIDLSNNSSLKQIDMQGELLHKQYKMLNTAFQPTLALVGNYQYQSISNTNWNIGKYNWSDAATITLSLSIPLYKAGNFTSLKTNKIQQQQLAETRINTERMLGMQAQSYVDNMTASAEQLQSNKAAVELAEKGLEISQKRYDVGKGTILELTNSQVSLTNTRLSYNNTIYDYLVAKSDLNKVLGKE